MGHFWRFLAVLLLAFVCANAPAVALESASSTITVTASVAPAKYVFLSDDLQIQKIVSNCNSGAEPVFISSHDLSLHFVITPELMQKYQQIKYQNNLNNFGTVYQLPAFQPASEKSLMPKSSLTSLFQSRFFGIF
jgi:hypothetical protein